MVYWCQQIQCITSVSVVKWDACGSPLYQTERFWYKCQFLKKKFLKLLKRFALSEDNGNQIRAASHRVTFTEFYWRCGRLRDINIWFLLNIYWRSFCLIYLFLVFSSIVKEFHGRPVGPTSSPVKLGWMSSPSVRIFHFWALSSPACHLSAWEISATLTPNI